MIKVRKEENAENKLDKTQNILILIIIIINNE